MKCSVFEKTQYDNEQSVNLNEVYSLINRRRVMRIEQSGYSLIEQSMLSREDLKE